MTLTDLSLYEPLPIQTSQEGNYVVINDPNFPPLSCVVVNGYDAFGNALSSIQIFPRTVKLVRNITTETFDASVPNPIQLSQVTNYIPYLDYDLVFPHLSTIVVDGYDAFGNAISSVQVTPRTISITFPATGSSFNRNAPQPIQLSQVTNYAQISSGINPLSTIVVDGYNAFGSPISSVQFFPRQVCIVKEVDGTTLDFNAPNPIQLQQVTNYVNIVNDDTDFPALSTIIVEGYNAFGNAISSVQVFPRTASLVYTVDPLTTLDVTQPLPIQLAQIGNYVPLAIDDPDFPALSATVINGYDAFGNAISSIQVFPRMVSLVYDTSQTDLLNPLIYSPTTGTTGGNNFTNLLDWWTEGNFEGTLHSNYTLGRFQNIPFGLVKSLQFHSNFNVSGTVTNSNITDIQNLSSYTSLQTLEFIKTPYAGINSFLHDGLLPASVDYLLFQDCSLTNDFGENHHPALTNVVALEIRQDPALTFLDLSHLDKLQELIVFETAVSGFDLFDCTSLNSLYFPSNNSLLTVNLSTCSNISSIYSHFCTSLSSINITSLTGIQVFDIQYASLAGLLDISNNSLLSYFDVSYNVLSAVKVPAPTLQGVFYNISENSLSQASVDDILSTCAVNASIAINSYLGLDGGYNASPSSVGLSAKALLETYNWTVMVN